MTRAKRVAGPPAMRFAAKYDVSPNGCWVWQAKRTRHGYGSFGIASGNSVLAHRFSYELAHGPIPDGLQIDHLCRVRHCVNPAHLEAVTQAENIRRGAKGPILKTHCIHGHALTGTNVYVDPHGHRNCKPCRRAGDARRASRRIKGKRISIVGWTGATVVLRQWEAPT